MYGHPNSARFRSPAEFIPHIIYLSTYDPKSQTAAKPCVCKYCLCPPRASGKTAARTITMEGILQARSHAAALERLGEQGVSGWVARKGEVVWVWTGEEKDLYETVDIADSELWAAGLVLEKPSDNPPFRPPQNAGGFASINMSSTPPWYAKNDASTYKIQLCSGAGETTPGKTFENVRQYFIKPWLSRPDFIQPPAGKNKRREHPSVDGAREITKSFSLFEYIVSTTPPERVDESHPTAENKAHIFNGMFLGAEKIFIGDPVRILDPTNPGRDYVLVLDHIYALTNPSEECKGKTWINMVGSIYYKANNAKEKKNMVKPEIFAQLPFRMRCHDPREGGTVIWCPLTDPGTLSEVSFERAQGRWYEPEAVMYWMYPDEDAKLAHSKVSWFVKNRIAAIGWSHFNGIKIVSDEDLCKPTISLTNEQMEKMQGSLSAKRKAASTSSATALSAFARVKDSDEEGSDGSDIEEDVEEIEDEIEEFDEEDTAPPSKKMAIR